MLYILHTRRIRGTQCYLLNTRCIRYTQCYVLNTLDVVFLHSGLPEAPCANRWQLYCDRWRFAVTAGFQIFPLRKKNRFQKWARCLSAAGEMMLLLSWCVCAVRVCTGTGALRGAVEHEHDHPCLGDPPRAVWQHFLCCCQGGDRNSF